MKERRRWSHVLLRSKSAKVFTLRVCTPQGAGARTRCGIQLLLQITDVTERKCARRSLTSPNSQLPIVAKGPWTAEQIERKKKKVARVNTQMRWKKALTSPHRLASCQGVRARCVFCNDDNWNRALAFINRRYFSFPSPLTPKLLLPSMGFNHSPFAS